MDRNKHITNALSKVEQVQAVILYGPDEAHLIVVARDLEPATLRALAAPCRWWLDRAGVWPRLLTPQLIKNSLDVFPIEMLELSQRRRVLHGRDPFVDLEVSPAALRVQCERELREKLMRLREAYVEHHNERAMRGLLAASLASFTRIFRACLVLLGETPPLGDREVISAFCTKLDLDAAPFHAVAIGSDKSFDAYYRVLMAAEERIDRLVIGTKERT
jgi:hypothetical protein